MKSRGVVFLSSVFRGLKHLRSEVRELLVHLGYDVWVAEEVAWPKPSFAELSASICLLGIDASDYYLGIFPGRYGSDPLGLSFTELEYHHAAGRMMPRFLYQLRDQSEQTDDQRIKQRGFLNILRDADISTIRPKRIESQRQLLNAIKKDFSDLVPSGASRKVDFGKSLQLWFSCLLKSSDGCGFESWADRIEQLNRSAKVSLTLAKSIGIAHLLMAARYFDFKDNRFLRGFDEYLASWTGVSAWSGISGYFGQTNISKARISLSQMLGKYNDISRLAMSVSSGLYSERKLGAALRWCEIGSRYVSAPEIKGAISLATGDLDSAESCFHRVLRRPNLNAADAALHHGYLATTLARMNRHSAAERELGLALSFAGIPAEYSTRVWRAHAQTSLQLGDQSGALQAIETAEMVANNAELRGQVKKAQLLKRQLLIQCGLTTPLGDSS